MIYKIACCLLLAFTFSSPSAFAKMLEVQDSTTNNPGTLGKSSYNVFESHNLVKNPDFELKCKHWILGKFQGGTGIFLTDSVDAICQKRSAIITTSNHDQELEDVRLFTPVELPAQELYMLTFNAKVDKTCLISISIGNESTTVYEEKLLLRPGMKHYGPFVFNNDYNDPFLFLSFNLGKTSQKIIIDDVGLYLDLPSEYTNPQITNVNVLKNQRQIASNELSKKYRELEGAFPK